MKTAYLSLGSNLGDREANLREAIERLTSSDIVVKRISSTYETEPQDLRDQPWFLNLVIEIETPFFPMQLLDRIGRIERDMGRKRIVSKGPRNIDIDIILFGKFVIDTPQLQVPHPRMAERRFVLEPLSELAAEFRHPILRRTIRELLEINKGQAIRKYPNQVL